MHCSVPCVAHASPVAATPPAQLHSLNEHSRSLSPVGALDSYWCALHCVCAAHVPPLVGVGAASMYSSLSHALVSLHVRGPSPTTPHMKPGLLLSGCHEWPLAGMLHMARSPLASPEYEHSPRQRAWIASKPLGM